nr:hypothetical protein Iba_chr04fCG10480 [Ipomoea batatas]
MFSEFPGSESQTISVQFVLLFTATHMVMVVWTLNWTSSVKSWNLENGTIAESFACKVNIGLPNFRCVSCLDFSNAVGVLSLLSSPLRCPFGTLLSIACHEENISESSKSSAEICAETKLSTQNQTFQNLDSIELNPIERLLHSPATPCKTGDVASLLHRESWI